MTTKYSNYRNVTVILAMVAPFAILCCAMSSKESDGRAEPATRIATEEALRKSSKSRTFDFKEEDRIMRFVDHDTHVVCYVLNKVNNPVLSCVHIPGGLLMNLP